MKAKYLMIGLAAALALILITGGLILRPFLSAKDAARTSLPDGPAQTSEKAPAAEKTFSKDMGGLTIRTLNAGNRPAALRAKLFKAVDPGSAVYAGPLVANKMRELAPGSYDIELDTAPQKIYKGIKVSAGRETIEDLGCLTGILNVKIMNAKNKAASYPIKIYHVDTGEMVIAVMTNRPLELLAGTYDIEIGTLPKILEAGVVVEPGKEKALDLGIVTGTLIIKAVDEKGIERRDARQTVNVKKTGTNEPILKTKVNRRFEIRQGTYNVEIGTLPPQINKDVKVKPGEDTVVEVVIHASSREKPPVPAASLPRIALPAKGR